MDESLKINFVAPLSYEGSKKENLNWDLKQKVRRVLNLAVELSIVGRCFLLVGEAITTNVSISIWREQLEPSNDKKIRIKMVDLKLIRPITILQHCSVILMRLWILLEPILPTGVQPKDSSSDVFGSPIGGGLGGVLLFAFAD